jgi:nucleotide-binding universal stress UspA family protein
MFKNMMVHIPTERSLLPMLDSAISLAASADAHLDGLAVGYEATNIPFVAEGGAAVASIFEVEQERARERAEAALRVFETKARHAGISYATRADHAIPTEARAIVCAAARLHDLTIVMQPETDHDSYDNVISREILFQAGGPVLFMPYIFRGAFSANRIGICWDGSRLAARALHDAMPLLQRADVLTVVAITDPDWILPDSSTDHLLAYLEKSGLSAKVVSLPSIRSDIQPSILSIASDENLDLLVMGGYGHSRLQETLLGGVTRDMLQSMTVPVLMSH